MLSLREASCRGFVLCDGHEHEPSWVKGPEARLVFEVLVAVVEGIQAVRIASYRGAHQNARNLPARSCWVEVY